MSSQDEIPSVSPVTIEEEVEVKVEVSASAPEPSAPDAEEEVPALAVEISASPIEPPAEEKPASDSPREEVLSPKRALTSIVGDFEQFERFHTEYLEEAQAVFACVTSLRFALREFRKRVQQELTLE